MSILESPLPYRCHDVDAEGFVARPDDDATHPVVMIVHAYKGLQESTRERARDLARLGYIGVCADLYGRGNRGADHESASALMAPLVSDRGGVLRDRLAASLTAARAVTGADPWKVAAMGYCFGGLCVLDLVRAGADLRGVISFHGLLNGFDFGQTPRGKVLVCHGYDDPLAPPARLTAFCDEMTTLSVDWQVHAYGHTVHSFTNPEAADRDRGTVYDETAATRAWGAARAFLRELFEADDS